jgi:hypothetical protein
MTRLIWLSLTSNNKGPEAHHINDVLDFQVFLTVAWLLALLGADRNPCWLRTVFIDICEQTKYSHFFLLEMV